MKELKIAIYKGDVSNPETTVKIPLSALKIVNALIPKKIKEKILNEGVNLQEIIKATEAEDVSGKLMEIQDKEDHIIISID